MKTPLSLRLLVFSIIMLGIQNVGFAQSKEMNDIQSGTIEAPTHSFFSSICFNEGFTMMSFVVNNPNNIFQGSEAPLDYAWLNCTLKGKLPKGLRKAILKPGSLFMKSISQIKGCNVTSRESMAIEEPGGHGALSELQAARKKINLFLND